MRLNEYGMRSISPITKYAIFNDHRNNELYIHNYFLCVVSESGIYRFGYVPIYAKPTDLVLPVLIQFIKNVSENHSMKPTHFGKNHLKQICASALRHYASE